MITLEGIKRTCENCDSYRDGECRIYASAAADGYTDCLLHSDRMTLKEAIKEMEDLHDSLVKHYNRGGEFAKPQLEATEWALRCMNGVLRVPINAQECVQVSCKDCCRNKEEISGRVCSLYADKADEIRRIHEEGE